MSPASRSTTPDVRKILGRLGRLRARVRAILATVGIGRLVVFLVGVLALFFLADWLLDLPLSVRRFVRLGLLQPPESMPLWALIPALVVSVFLAIALTRRGHKAAPLFCFLTAGLAGLLTWAAFRVFVPLKKPMSDSDLALSVESRFKHLNDRLAAALDFDKELGTPTRGESPAMMAAVVEEAAEEVRALSFSKAVSGTRALRWAGGALAAILVAVGISAALPDETGLWARRSLLLEDVAWPRATSMIAVDLQPDGSFVEHDPTVAYEVPIGRSLTVYARAVGKTPDEAQVLDIVQGQAPLARRMFSVPGAGNVFAYEFLDVRRAFAFVMRGGDDEDDIPSYQVEITIPPRVLSMRSTVTFPAYLGREPEDIADGSVTVPQGAKVALVFTTDLPVEKAHAVLGDQTLTARATETADGQARREFSFSYTAETTADGRVVLRTPDGKENDPAADSFAVRVKTDQPPRIDWIWPRTSIEVTPGGRVPVLVQSRDDHTLAGVTLQIRVNALPPTEILLREWREDAPKSDSFVSPAANNGPLGRKRILTYVPIEMAQLTKMVNGKPEPLVMGDAVSLRMIAQDSRGQVRESELMRVDVRSPAELERGLHTQRSNVRMALEAVRREQNTRRDDVKAILGSALGDAELDLLKTVRFSQGKIAQDADRAVQELIEIFNAFVYDRLGADNPNGKILALYDRHHRRTYGLESERSDEPALRPIEARGDWTGDAVFPYALYDEVVQAWKDDAIFDKGLLDKMLRALGDAVNVGARLAPRTHRAAADAINGDRKALETLLAAQEANLTALDTLLGSMRGWQSLHEMKMTLRTLIEEQEVNRKLLDGGDGNAPKKDAPKKVDSKK